MTDELSLIYYPNPPIPLSRGFEAVSINELNFIEPFAPPIFEPLAADEEDEFNEILKNLSGQFTIPSCERPHAPPEFDYIEKKHLDGYPEEFEHLEDSGPGFHVDAFLGHIGNVKHDENLHKLYHAADSDTESSQEEINVELQKKAESEAKKRAAEMAEREAKARAEESLRKAEEAKKKAEEARKLAEEARKKQKKEEEKRKQDEMANLPPVLRNRFKNLNIVNPGGAPTTLGHMKRIIQSNVSNEATVNRPSAQ